MAKPSQRISGLLSFFSGRYAPAFLTFLLLAAGFFLYFEVIVSKNENDLKQRNFRGLQRMAMNIASKLENYHSKNALNFFQNLKLHPESDSLIREEYGLEKLTDTGLLKNTSDSIIVGLSDDWRFLFRDTSKHPQFAGTRVRKFVSPILRRDLFSNYIFGFRDIILFDELNICQKRFSSWLTDKRARDSVSKNMVQEGQVWNIEIGGKPYKLFLLCFTVMDRYSFSIGGYMPAELYQTEKNHIPIYAILWLIIGLILVILMFPLLKLFLMHRSEQLLVRDVITSLASIHVLGALTILAALNTFVYFSMSIPAMNLKLKDLGSSIENTLRSEISAALTDINSSTAKITKGFHLQDEDSVFILKKSNAQQTFASQIPLNYPYLESITFTDSSGQNKIRWTTKPYLPTPINVRDRDYFQAVHNGELWRWDNKDSFYLTSISSWNSNENQAIIATSFSTNDSPRIQVITLSSRFHSLFDALLPEGYGFCIIDQSGEVKFHLDSKRNLNENLVEECDDNSVLRSILYSRSKAYFGSRYSGESQRFYVKPISNTPYFLVTFCKMQQLWSEDLDVISVSSILSLMNLAIILVVILTLQISGYRDSILQNQSILFTWLKPNNFLITAYSKVTAFYICSMILQLIFFLFYRGSDFLSLVGIAFSYSYILISFAYYQFGIASKKYDADKVQKIKSFYWLLGLFGLVNIIFIVNLDGKWLWFVLAEILLIAVGVIISRQKKINLKLESLSKDKIPKTSFINFKSLLNRNFRWWYILSFYTFIIAASVMPLIIFYFISFKHERLLSLKRNQIEFASNLFQKHYDSSRSIKDSLVVSYRLPYHFNIIANEIKRPASGFLNADTSINQFDYLFNKIKPVFSIYSREFGFLNNSPDSSVLYNWETSGDTLILHYNSLLNRSYFDTSRALVMRTHIESVLEKTHRADFLSFVLFLASVILLLTGFYYLVRRLLKKVFFDGYDISSTYRESEIPLILSLPENEHVYVNGPPNSSKYQRINDILDPKLLLMQIDIVTLLKNDIQFFIDQFTAAYINFKPLKQPDKPIILVRHFELFASNPAITEKKLMLLEFLLQQRVQIIVLSSRSFEAMPLNILPGSPTEIKYAEERWSNVMNNFYMLYHCWKKPNTDMLADEKNRLYHSLENYGSMKLNKIDKSTEIKSIVLNSYYDQVKNLLISIDEECAHSDFLWGLRKTIFQFLENHKSLHLKFDYLHGSQEFILVKMDEEFKKLFEQVCLKIQSLSVNYYLSLWQSLSKDEQRTLYDISLDEIVNPANRDIAGRLTGLGLVIPETEIACYHIMNKSFRNFIFSQLSKSEISFIKEEAAEKGSWNTFQLPILLIVIGVGLFLFITQRDAFTNLVSYLGAAAAGIAALLKVLGMVPSSKT